MAEVAVKGVPHPVMGEAIWAFLVPEPGANLDPRAIGQHCSRLLGRARTPTSVRFVDRLPRTPSGKVRKHLLDARDVPGS